MEQMLETLPWGPSMISISIHMSFFLHQQRHYLLILFAKISLRFTCHWKCVLQSTVNFTSVNIAWHWSNCIAAAFLGTSCSCKNIRYKKDNIYIDTYNHVSKPGFLLLTCNFTSKECVDWRQDYISIPLAV